MEGYKIKNTEYCSGGAPYFFGSTIWNTADAK